MATVLTTVEIDADEISLALEAISNLGYTVADIAEGCTSVRFATTEPISVARMLGNFWTEFADISEVVPPLD